MRGLGLQWPSRPWAPSWPAWFTECCAMGCGSSIEGQSSTKRSTAGGRSTLSSAKPPPSDSKSSTPQRPSGSFWREGKSSPGALRRSACIKFLGLQLAFVPLGGGSSSIENQTIRPELCPNLPLKASVVSRACSRLERHRSQPNRSHSSEVQNAFLEESGAPAAGSVADQTALLSTLLFQRAGQK